MIIRVVKLTERNFKEMKHTPFCEDGNCICPINEEEITMKPTKTPWVAGIKVNGKQTIFGFNRIPVTVLDNKTKDEDIAYLINCVNNHAKLVEALDHVLTSIKGDSQYTVSQRIIEQALNGIGE